MEVSVLIEGDFVGCPAASWLQSMAGQVLSAQDTGADVELSLVIISQEKVRQLNKSYRGKDEPTDVLAFAMSAKEGTGSSHFILPPEWMPPLGEVIISYPQAVLQAKERQHSIKKEIAILIIHGVLHLLGYDHEESEPERQMRAKEEEILSSIGVD
jgi:probable rRNA maturation factor